MLGRSRGEHDGNAYHGHVTIAALFGSELLGVDSAEGETNSGPFSLIQTAILDVVCDGSDSQICVDALRADSSSDAAGSHNSFSALNANLGGADGVSAGVARSDGEISGDGNCQSAHGSSDVADASVFGILGADAISAASDAKGCDDGSSSRSASSNVVELNNAGLPLPVPGCADGTPDSEFDAIAPIAAAVCNADAGADAGTDGAGDSIVYGVREGLTVMLVGNVAKLTTGGSESAVVLAAAARGGHHHGHHGHHGGQGQGDPSNRDSASSAEPPADGSGDRFESSAPAGALPFTGSDLVGLLAIAAIAIGAGLILAAMTFRPVEER